MVFPIVERRQYIAQNKYDTSQKRDYENRVLNTFIIIALCYKSSYFTEIHLQIFQKCLALLLSTLLVCLFAPEYDNPNSFAG